MNLSALKELKEGDKIIFTIPFPPFTVGKEYSVFETEVGKTVCDDTGDRRWFLKDDQIRLHFNRSE